MHTKIKLLSAVFLILFFLAPICPTRSAKETPIVVKKSAFYKSLGEKMIVSSTSFTHGSFIPRLYTCQGNDQYPPISWRNISQDTKSIALIMDDPDAPHGTFVHWVAWNIDPKRGELPPNQKQRNQEFSEGTNSVGRIGYMGPCPPSGVHRYFFKLYALDTQLYLSSNSTKEDLLQAMAGHIIEEGQLMGKYQKLP